MKQAFFKQASTLQIFASYYKPHKKLFLLDMLCAVLVAAINLAFPIISRNAMNDYLPSGMFQTFFTVMMALIVANLLKIGLQYFITYWGHDLGCRMEKDIRGDLFSHMQTLSFSYFDKHRTGAIMTNLTGDLFEISELAHHGPEDLFISVLTILGSFAIMFPINWKLSLLLAVVIPLYIVFSVQEQRKMMRASRNQKDELGRISSDIESSISGIRVAKAFANEDKEREKFHRANLNYRHAKKNYYKSMATFFSVMEFTLGILPILVIIGGGMLYMSGEMNFVDLVTFNLFVSTFLQPVRKLANFSELLVQGMSGFSKFVSIMRIDPDIMDAPDAADLADVKGDIEVDSVSFSYEDGVPVLENVSLSVQMGETVAVVGPSGGGKSTLCQLVPRFYDVNSGSIRIDGQDVRKLTQTSLHQNIGVVQQDVFLFAGTIYDNIQYGKAGATDEEIIAAAKKAEIYDDIMAMPKGFETYVGERGALLSGGQKQRISIARIFLKNPPILILDEATSALDSVTEARIQNAFDALTEGRTTLIIAHRLSTIRKANRIIVIDENRIVEEGTQEQLLASGGAYAALYQSQFGGTTLGTEQN